MRKICKIMITCIMFCVITTATYATTDILPENKFGIKKAAILGAGIFLVVQILFIAYQKDKLQESLLIEDSKIKEKSLKVEKNEKSDKKRNPVEINVDETTKKIKKSLDIEQLENDDHNIVDKLGNVAQSLVTDKIEKVDQILDIKQLEKLENEEKNLFTSLNIENKIETLPDKMSPKKRSITLKKEIIFNDAKNINSKKIDAKKMNKKNNKKIIDKKKIGKKVIDEKHIDKKENADKIISRGKVKIVRERKNRTTSEIEDNKTTKEEVQSKKRETKAEGEAKKRETKLEGKIKKEEIKAKGKQKIKEIKVESKNKKRNK